MILGVNNHQKRTGLFFKENSHLAIFGLKGPRMSQNEGLSHFFDKNFDFTSRIKNSQE